MSFARWRLNWNLLRFPFTKGGGGEASSVSGASCWAWLVRRARMTENRWKVVWNSAFPFALRLPTLTPFYVCVSHFNFAKQTAGYLFPQPLFRRLFRVWVWKLYLSGCLLFGLIICQKKLPQIEYLHKFIETAIGREMFDKGKENIEGVAFTAPLEEAGWYLSGSLLPRSFSWFLVGLFVMLCLEYNSGWRKEN